MLGLFFNKDTLLTLLKKQPYFKKMLWHRCFPVNFAKILTSFLQSTTVKLNATKRPYILKQT